MFASGGTTARTAVLYPQPKVSQAKIYVRASSLIAGVPESLPTHSKSRARRLDFDSC